jgi:AcrR family transcriptional regulator
MPRITPRAREERRRVFIEAAWRVAAAKGYRNWTVDDVCDEAGLSKGAFYGYYEGKEDLLLALLEEDASWRRTSIEDLSRHDLSGAERLGGFIRNMLGEGEDQGRAQVRADLWAEMVTNETVRERFVATVHQRRKLLQQWIETAIASGELVEVPAKAMASIVLALSDGLALHRAIDPTGLRWSNIRKALDALLAGVSRAPASAVRSNRPVGF